MFSIIVYSKVFMNHTKNGQHYNYHISSNILLYFKDGKLSDVPVGYTYQT